MDSWASWAILLLLTIMAGAWMVRYAISEYETYLYNRKHGWQ